MDVLFLRSLFGDLDGLSVVGHDVTVHQLLTALKSGLSVYGYKTVLNCIFGIYTRLDQAGRFQRLAQFNIIVS